MQAQASDFDLRSVAGRVRLKFGGGYGFARNQRVCLRRELGGYGLALQTERSRSGWTFGEDEGIFWIGAEAVLARLEPEQASQGQPFLLKILHQFAFPFDRMTAGRPGRLRLRLACPPREQMRTARK